jgi:hexosaminidase
VWEIKHLLDTMSWTKFNVLHWHITDEQSYPLQSHAYPDLVRGSWDTMARYTWKDVREIIEFARLRGIHVIPEIDMPGHSKSWGTAYPSVITSYVKYKNVFN